LEEACGKRIVSAMDTYSRVSSSTENVMATADIFSKMAIITLVNLRKIITKGLASLSNLTGMLKRADIPTISFWVL
jgi:soluble P-type ATPase